MFVTIKCVFNMFGTVKCVLNVFMTMECIWNVFTTKIKGVYEDAFWRQFVELMCAHIYGAATHCNILQQHTHTLGVVKCEHDGVYEDEN